MCFCTESPEEVGSGSGLGGTSLPNQYHWMLDAHHQLQEPSSPHRIHRRDQDLVELSLWVMNILWHFLAPWHPLFEFSVIEILVQSW